MKKFALMMMAAMLTLGAAAQDVKIGYVSTNEIMMLMPEIKTVETEIATFNETNSKYIQDMYAEIQAKAQAFENEKASLPDAIRRAREEELLNMQERLQTTYQTLQQEAQAKQQELLKPIQERVAKAIEAVGQKNNFLMILETEAGLLYKSPKMVDATPLIKKELGIIQ